MTRRFLLRGAAALAAARFGSAPSRPSIPARQLERILARIRPAAIPRPGLRRHPLRRSRGGKSKPPRPSRGHRRPAPPAGGGRVVIPAGIFLTGAIHLASNVNLHLEEGATLRFSQRSKGLSAAGFHPLGKHRVHELLAASFTPSSRPISPSPERARWMARPTWTTGGCGRATRVQAARDRPQPDKARALLAARRKRRAGEPARLRRGLHSAAHLRAALPLDKCV